MRGFSWRAALLGAVVAYLILIVAGFGLLYAGVYDVGATTAHWPITERMLDLARRHSVAAHATGIQAPSDLDNPDKIAFGLSHYADHCAVCHGAPGAPKDDLAQGMYPTPPDLAVVSQQYTAPQLFWILRHGIKMTGMPSWSDHTDDDLWAIVAFLKKLPDMSEGDYAKMLMSNMAHGMMHHHGGGESGEAAPSANPSTSSP